MTPILSTLNVIAAILVAYSIHKKNYEVAAFMFTLGLFSHLLSIIALLSK